MPSSSMLVSLPTVEPALGLQTPRPYQAPTLIDIGAIHALTATSCDPAGPSDSGAIVNPFPGGCDWK